MKNLLKSILPIFFILMVSSCQDQNDKLIQKIEVLSMVEIQAIAEEHNEALQQTLIGLKESQISKVEDPKEMEKILNRELNFFYESHFNANNLNDAKNYSEKEVLKFFSRANSNLRTNGMTPIEIVIDEASGKLSDEQIKLLLDIDIILNSIASDINSALTLLDELEDKAINTLTEEEAQVIPIGAEVEKTSITYWYENMDEWDEVINSNEGARNSRTKGWFSWSEVGGADVAGAVGGAVGAAAVNVVPGLGQASYGAAIVGGATAASAADAVIQAWKHFVE
jgi:hypothetical protein